MWVQRSLVRYTDGVTKVGQIEAAEHTQRFNTSVTLAIF